MVSVYQSSGFVTRGSLGFAPVLARDACRAPLIFLAVVMDGAFAASLTGFLAMHGQLLGANCTTIEVGGVQWGEVKKS